MTNQISDQDMKANYKWQSNYHCCLKFISRLSMIILLNIVLNRTVVDSDWRFNSLWRTVIGSILLT